MEIYIYKTADEVIEGLANYFVQAVNSVMKVRNECTVVLSGGNSPRKLYELLAIWNFSQQIDRDKIYFFFGDERYVPFILMGSGRLGRNPATRWLYGHCIL